MADGTQTYTLEGQTYTVPVGTSMDELDEYIKSQSKSPQTQTPPANVNPNINRATRRNAQAQPGVTPPQRAADPTNKRIMRGIEIGAEVAPLVPIGMEFAAAPLATLGKVGTSLAGSAIGSEVGRTGTRWLGGGKEAQDVAGYAGALGGGLAGWREPPARVGWRGLGVDIPEWLRPEGAALDAQKGLGAFMNRGYKPVESPKVITMAPETTSSGEAPRYSAPVSRPPVEGYSGASTGPPAEITVRGATRVATEAPRGSQGARPTPGEQRLSDLLSKQIITPEDQREVVRSLGDDALPQQGESTAAWKARVKGLIRAGRNARGVPDTESYPAPRRFNR